MNYLKAKVILYYLNAINDAYLARELCLYLARREHNNDKRVNEYVKASKGNKDYLYGIAYTLYIWNGFYDFMWGRFIEKFLPADLKKDIPEIVSNIENTFKIEPYREFGETTILLRPLLWLIFGRFIFKNEFIGTFNDIKFPKPSAIIRGMIITQKLNIRSNLGYMKDFRAGKVKSQSVKYNILESLTSKNEKLERGLTASLMGASVWDALFLNILRVRFPAKVLKTAILRN